MKITRDLFGPLYRDLLHLEVYLVAHPMTGRTVGDRTVVPNPETQALQILESYAGIVRALDGSAEEEGRRGIVRAPVATAAAADAAAEEAASSRQTSARSGPVDLRHAFRKIERDAGEQVKNIDERGNMSAAGAPVPRAFTPGAAEVVREGPESRDILVDDKQKLLRIQNNSRELLRILDEANYQPPPAEASFGPAVPRSAVKVNGKPPPSPTALSQTGEPAAGEVQPEMELTPEHIMQIRKMWEVRPEDGILMRTVISMDGDVIAYVHPLFAGAEFKYLHELHGSSVQTSVEFWKELVGILSDFVSSVVGFVFTSGRRQT